MPQAPVPEEMNVYQNAEARFEVAANKLGLEQGVYRYLKYPSKEVTLYIPIGMDNGQLEVFTGYRVLHSTVRGPGKGGIRFAPDVSLDEVRVTATLARLPSTTQNHLAVDSQARCGCGCWLTVNTAAASRRRAPAGCPTRRYRCTLRSSG